MARLDETVELNHPAIWAAKVKTAFPHTLRRAELTRRKMAQKAKRKGNVVERRRHIESALLLRVTRSTGYTFWDRYAEVGEASKAVLVGRYARLFFKKDFVVLEH